MRDHAKHEAKGSYGALALEMAGHFVIMYLMMYTMILMAAGALAWVSIPIALFIGAVGAVSVFKAVYVDRRELKCACVGGGSKVPLGFVSLAENLMMIAMAVWMLARHG